MLQEFAVASRQRKPGRSRRRRSRGDRCASLMVIAAVVGVGGIGTAKADCTVTSGAGTVDAPDSYATITCNANLPNPWTTWIGTYQDFITVNILSNATVSRSDASSNNIYLESDNIITNAGAILNSAQWGWGIYVQDRNQITNAVNGVINVSGLYGAGINADADNTIVNYGTIHGTSDSVSAIIVGDNNTVTNAVTGVIVVSGQYSDGINVFDGNTIVNAGSIVASGEVDYGIIAYSENNIVNTGAIIMTGDSSAGITAGDPFGGPGNQIANSGTIVTTGLNANGVFLTNDNTLTNSGTIAATGEYGTAVYAGGTNNTITNAASGRMVVTGDGGMAVAFGVAVSSPGVPSPSENTLLNYGLIRSTGSGGFALIDVVGSGVTSTTIDNYGTIDGTINLAVGNDSLTNRGTIQVSSGPLVVHQIQGTFTQTATGVLAMRVVPVGSIPQPSSVSGDLLSIVGSADLGGTLRPVPLAGLYADTQQYTLITTTTSINSSVFATADQYSAFLVPTLNYTTNTVELTLTRVPFGSFAGATANQQSVGNALEVGYARLLGGDPGAYSLLSYYQNLFAAPASQAGPLLDALSGEAHTAFQTVGIAGGFQFQEQLLDRLRGAPGSLPSSVLSATNPGMEGQFAQLHRTATDATSPMAAAAPTPRLAWTPWASGQGVFGRVDDQTGASGYSYELASGAAGIDWQISDNFLAGAALGYTHSSFSLSQRSDQGTINSLRTAVYGRYLEGPLRLSGVLSYAWNQYDSDREILIPAGTSQRATARYDGHEIGVAAEAGYTMTLAGATVEPLAGLSFISLHQDPFTEQSGGAFALAADGTTFNALRSTVGVRASQSLRLSDAVVLTPEVRARWGHEFLDEQPMLNTQLVSLPGTAMAIRGAAPGRDAALLGAGLTATIGENLAFFLNYDTELRDGLDAHAVTGGLRLLTGPVSEAGRASAASAIFGHEGNAANRPDERRPWDLSLRTYVAYDSNIPQETRAGGFPGDTGSAVFGASLYGAYRVYRDGVWEFGADGQIGTAQPVNDDVRDYAYTFIDPRLYVRRAFRLGDWPARAGGSYGFRYDWLRGHPYAHSHILTAEGVANPTADTEARVAYTLSIDRFQDDSVDPATNSRDALQHRLDIGGAYTFDQGQRAVRLTYEFRYNDAEGSNFTFASHGIRGRFTSRLPYGTTGLLEAAYTSAGYTDFVTTPRRTNDIQEYRAALYFPITDNVTGDLSYGYTRADADESLYAYDRHQVALGVTTRF